jgi:hypothetical protein
VSAHHVLGILEDDEQRLWATLAQAIAVAEAEHARLTLAKTTDPGWLMRWFAPAALNAMCVSSEELDFRTAASHKLARAAEFVPGCVPRADRADHPGSARRRGPERRHARPLPPAAVRASDARNPRRARPQPAGRP